MNFEETKEHAYVNNRVKFWGGNIQDKSLKETRKQRHKQSFNKS